MRIAGGVTVGLVVLVMATSCSAADQPLEGRHTFRADFGSKHKADGRTRKSPLGGDVTGHIEVTYYYESSTQRYVYEYSLFNDGSSPTSLDLFGLAIPVNPVEVLGPSHWTAFKGYQGNPIGIVWGVTDDYGAPDDGLSYYESIYNVHPGTSTSGFTLKSIYGPGPVEAYVGTYAPDQIDPEGLDEDVTLISPTIWDGEAGVIEGPGPATVDVRIRDGIKFYPAMPNPARVGMKVGLYLPRGTLVKLTVYDVSGRLVATAVEDRLSAGPQILRWDGRDRRGRDAPAGVYAYQVEVGGQCIAKERVIIVR